MYRKTIGLNQLTYNHDYSSNLKFLIPNLMEMSQILNTFEYDKKSTNPLGITGLRGSGLIEELLNYFANDTQNTPPDCITPWYKRMENAKKHMHPLQLVEIIKDIIKYKAKLTWPNVSFFCHVTKRDYIIRLYHETNFPPDHVITWNQLCSFCKHTMQVLFFQELLKDSHVCFTGKDDIKIGQRRLKVDDKYYI